MKKFLLVSAEVVSVVMAVVFIMGAGLFFLNWYPSYVVYPSLTHADMWLADLYKCCIFIGGFCSVGIALTAAAEHTTNLNRKRAELLMKRIDIVFGEAQEAVQSGDDQRIRLAAIEMKKLQSELR